MDSNNGDNIIDNKIESENIINDNGNNSNLSKDIQDKNENNLEIDNFNLIDNEEDDEEEEQNEAFIQELVKQGKYSEVIKFLESKDKKSKRKKNNGNNDLENVNEGNDNNSNINEEDEELVIIPADDISDLHEDINNNDDKNKEKDNNNINGENNIINNENLEKDKDIINNGENGNININENEKDNNANEKGDINKEIDKNTNIVKESGNENNNAKNDENNIIKEDNKNSLVNNFVEDKNKENNNDNNNNKENINKLNQDKNKSTINIQNKNDLSDNEKNKEDNQNNNNNIKDNNEKNIQSNEINNNNIIENNKTNNQSNSNNDIINNINSENKNNENNEDIRPKDLIKNIISNNNNSDKKNINDKLNSSNSSSSLLHLSFEEDEENNKYLEERLKEIQEQRKIFVEKTLPDQSIAVNNLELLTKELEELNELENNENDDLNGIEQMNEIYIMVQEDKLSALLQEKVREKLFPFYNKANFDINDVIKNDYFKSINFNRNFYISSKIFDSKSISKKKNNSNYNIDYPKSIFDNLKFDKSDIKSGLDYDEYLDEFLDQKNNNNAKSSNINSANDKIIKNSNSKIEKMFLSYKSKLKEKTKKDNNNKQNNIKPIKIFLNNKDKNKNKNKDNNDNNVNDSKLREKYEINLDEIYNKYKISLNSIEKNTDLKKYNNFFVDNFNKKNDIFNFNDYSIDLDLDDDIKKELTKNNQNNIEDKDKENYYLKINNSKAFDESILNNYSLVRFINLENNNLTKFPDFSKCPMIYSINMNNNKINKIEKISTLNYLEKLSLTNNNITSIENCTDNKRLRFLYLGHNKISNIDNISTELPFIEEIILCQNNINYLPNKIYLPYLKFCDLNENKISFDSNSHQLLYFICPSLEKLLLLGNNLNENGTQFLIKYCPKLKEIDLSFNKYNNIIELVKILSINSNWNDNLEMVNVVGNTFFNSNKNKEIFYLLIKRFCPSIKFINNEEIKKNKPNAIEAIKHNNILSSNNYQNLNCNLNENYINIYNSQNSFMKYFTSVYFTNKIFNIYNININNNLKTNNAELFLLINQTYFQFKLSHFISQISINKSNIGFFSYESNFQFDNLLTYLYKFKNRMEYITHSIPILVKRTWFRRMKIIKIQQQYKLRILRKKLAAIVIPDDEDDHAEDLLEFFNAGSKNEEEKMMEMDLNLDKKMKEIESNIEKNLKNKKSKSKSNFKALEVIKEEDKDLDNQVGIIQLDNKDSNTINKNNKIELNINKPKENTNHNNIINNNNHNNPALNGNIQSNNNKQIINKNDKNNIFNINNKKEIHSINENNNEKEKDELIMKLLSNPKYNSNNKLNPIRLTPISKNQNSTIQSTSNLTNNNNNNYNNNNFNNYNHQNIDLLKKGLGVNSNGNLNKNQNMFINYAPNMKQNHPHKIILKDDNYYGKLYDINAESNLPKNPSNIGIISGKRGEKYSGIRRPDSNGVVLPKIGSNNLNVSTTTLSNETKSVQSHLTTGKKFLKVSQNQGKVYSNKPKEVLMLEQECREAIQKAKAEWGFTNKETEELLVKKIQKKYRKKIQNILYKYG